MGKVNEIKKSFYKIQFAIHSLVLLATVMSKVDINPSYAS